MLDLYKGFSGFSEITGINQTLTESILGDTGVGGILSFTGGEAEEDLEKALEMSPVSATKLNTTGNSGSITP